MDARSTLITDTDKTSLIQIVTWALLAIAVLSVLLRSYAKWTFFRFLGADDFMLPASLLLLAAQSAIVTIQTLNGLGIRLEDMSPDQRETNYLFQWIATLLYIPSLCFSKLTTLYLLHLISTLKVFQRLFAATGIIIICWALSSEFLVAFQCSPPQPWRGGTANHCIDRRIIYTYLESMNAATDILLVILPFGVTLSISSSIRRKVSVLIMFAARILGPGVMLTKILLHWPSFADPQPSLMSWPFVVCTQLIQFLSLMSACILYMRPFVGSLRAGLINSEDFRGRSLAKSYPTDTKEAEAGERMPSKPATPPGLVRKQTSDSPLKSDAAPVAQWPLPVDPLEPVQDEVGVTKAIDLPSETVTGIEKAASRPMHEGIATRRYQLEQTKAGSVYAPSIASRHLVGPLRMPPHPRSEIPLGDNNLPRVSQIYSPLAEENGIMNYFAAFSNREHGGDEEPHSSSSRRPSS